jgi:hypothetical protein
MVDYNSLTDLLKIAYIFQYLEICVAGVGIVGNFLTFIVFLRKRFRNSSFGFYIKVMAITDSIVLMHSFRHWAAFIVDWNIDIVWPFFCPIGEYQPYTCASISCWLLALIAFDRWISIAYPNRFVLFKKRWFQSLLVCVIILANLLYFIILPLNYHIHEESTLNVTAVIKTCVIDLSPFLLGNWLFLIDLVLVCLNFCFFPTRKN